MKHNKISIYLLLFIVLFGASSQSVAKQGKNYAFIIGIDAYKDSQIKGDLTAKNDALGIGKLLKERLNFDVRMLMGKAATKSEIVGGIKNYSKELAQNDKLIIFFSGKSEIEPLYGYGWWLPYDSFYGDTMSYIDFVNISELINKINCDVLIVTNENVPPDFASSPVNEVNGGDGDGIGKFIITTDGQKAVRSSKNLDLSVLGFSFLEVLGSTKNDRLSFYRLVESMNKISEYDKVRLYFKYLSVSSQKSGDFVIPGFVDNKMDINDSDNEKKNEEKITDKKKFAFLLIKTDPIKVDFYLNEKKTALEKMKLEPGSYKIRVEKEGYESRVETINLKNDEKKEIHLELKKLPPKKGWLKVEIDPPNSNISFKSVDLEYKDNIKLLPGSYEIILKAPFYKDKLVKIDIEEGKGNLVKEKLILVDKYINSLGSRFVKIDKGRFKMGSNPSEVSRDKDEISHEVVLEKDFFIMEKEVTLKEWISFVEETDYKASSYRLGGAQVWIGFRWEKDNDYSWESPGFKQTNLEPITCVSYDDAIEFANWLSTKEGLNYSLPTEAQWEFSCKSGENHSFSYGECLLDSQANFAANSKRGDCPEGKHRNKTIESGMLKPNKWGLFDMHGNVMEWCLDWYGPYSSVKQFNPKGPVSGEYRVVRGGSWEADINSCRSANRFRIKPSVSRNNIGFRLVLLP